MQNKSSAPDPAPQARQTPRVSAPVKTKSGVRLNPDSGPLGLDSPNDSALSLPGWTYRCKSPELSADSAPDTFEGDGSFVH